MIAGVGRYGTRLLPNYSGPFEGNQMSTVGKNRRNDMPAPTPEPVHSSIARAREQLSKGDADGAALTLRQVSRQTDLPLSARMEIAKLLNLSGAQTEAINLYLEIGRKSLDAGDVTAARASLSAGHALDQKNYDALFELGRADLADGKKEEALAKFVEVLRKSNLRHLPALYEAAVLYEADGQADQAILAYKKIAERDRHHVPTLTRLAALYTKKGQLGEALGYYLQGARGAIQASQFSEARALIASALKIEDDNWEAKRLLAEVQSAEPQAAPTTQIPQSARPNQPAAAPSQARPAPTANEPKPSVAPPAARPAAPAAARPAVAAPPAAAAQPVASRPSPPPTPAANPNMTSHLGPAQTAASMPRTVAPATPAAPAQAVSAPTSAAQATSAPTSPPQMAAPTSPPQMAAPARTAPPAAAPPAQSTAPQSPAPPSVSGRPPVSAAIPPTAPPNVVPPERSTRESTAKAMAPEQSGADVPSIDLPGEVTLLEKEYEVTAKLAEISVEVAEAYKKRVAIERDMKVAKAALDALNTQRSSIESSIGSLKQELESVSQDKAGEDRALEELRLKLEASRADLEKLSDLPEFLKSVEAKSSAAADLVSNASTTLEAAQLRVHEAQTVSASVEKSASELTSAMDIARRQAEEAQDQLKGMLADAQAAQAEAAKADSSLSELRSAVAGLQQLKDQVNAARADLKSLSPTLEAKTAQATAAISQLESKRSARDSSFQAALADIDGIVSDGSQAVAAINGGTAPAGNGASGRAASQSIPVETTVAAAPSAGSAPAQRPSKVDAGAGNVEALVAAGRLDDALRASRDADSADPHRRMMEAARRLREGGNGAAAAKAYEKLTGGGNQTGGVRSGLALCYVELRRFKESLALFEGLSDDAFAVVRENGIGQSLRGLNRIDEAAQHFSKALEIPGHPDSEYREVLYNLADLYENRGDDESLNLAQWSFEEIQAGAPDYRDVSARISSLKERLTKVAAPDSKAARESQASRDGRF